MIVLLISCHDETSYLTLDQHQQDVASTCIVINGGFLHGTIYLSSVNGVDDIFFSSDCISGTMGKENIN